MNSIVQVQDVSKRFGQVNALTHISVDIMEGEIFGFIGPDGSGKTTLFRIMTTLLVPDAGSVEVLGFDVVREYKKIRPLLGYMPGRFSLYQDLSVEENLRFFASVFKTDLKENYALIEPIYSRLEPFRKRLAGNLSGGMKQKLALCCALIHKPKLLLLDEPTTGVDAVSRKEFWDMLAFLKEEGITVIVSTPYMDEAELCDRIALIQEGEFLKVDTPERVVSSFEKRLFGIKATDTYSLIKTLRSYSWAQSVHPFGDSVHYTDQRDDPDTEEIKRYLDESGIDQIVIQEIKPDIEDSFMALMSNGAGHV